MAKLGDFFHPKSDRVPIKPAAPTYQEYHLRTITKRENREHVDLLYLGNSTEEASTILLKKGFNYTQVNEIIRGKVITEGKRRYSIYYNTEPTPTAHIDLSSIKQVVKEIHPNLVQKEIPTMPASAPEPTLGSILREARVKSGISAALISTTVGKYPTFMSSPETGKTRPTKAVLLAICRELAIDPEPLLKFRLASDASEVFRHSNSRAARVAIPEPAGVVLHAPSPVRGYVLEELQNALKHTSDAQAMRILQIVKLVLEP